MGLTAKEKAEYTPIPVGLHGAICNSLIDVGTQYSEMFGNYSRQVVLGFELPNERGEFEKDGVMQSLPRVISTKMTLSLGAKSNMRKMLVSWRGRDFTPEELEGFDIKNLLSVPCLLNIVHNAKGKAKVDTAIKYKGEPLTGELPTTYFSFEEEDMSLPDSLPEWLAQMVVNAPEWGKKTEGTADGNGQQEGRPDYADSEAAQDDVPF